MFFYSREMGSFTLHYKQTTVQLPAEMKPIIMKPTYSLSEIRMLVGSLELPELMVLEALIEEEATWYPSNHLTEIRHIISTTRIQISNNELQLEYLLSFN